MDLMIKSNKNEVRKDIITQIDGFNVSDRYVPIATQDVIDEIAKQAGEIKITGFNNANVRKPGKDGFQKHAVICELPNSEMIDGTKMNIIIFNSNDRSTSLKIFMGTLRMACSNQMVWGEELTEPVTIRHTQKDWKKSVQYMIDEYEIVKLETEMMIETMLATEVSLGDTVNIIQRVVDEILHPDIVGTIFDPMQLNKADRPEDIGTDAWHLFNRLQYNLINGGIQRVIEKEDDDGILFNHISNTHKVTDVSKQIDFNRRLHTLVLEEIGLKIKETEDTIDAEPEDVFNMTTKQFDKAIDNMNKKLEI